MKNIINFDEYKKNKKENKNQYETIYTYDKKQNELEFEK